MTTSRKIQFQERFKEWVTTALGADFDALTPPRRSKLMARFFAENVLRPLNPTALPATEDEVEACIVDGSNDGGIDFISREGQTVVILQAKYCGGKSRRRPTQDHGEFEQFRCALDRLYNYRSLSFNRSLVDIAAEIDWSRDRFIMRFLTLYRATEDLARLAEQDPLLPPVKGLEERVELDLLDETKLNLDLRDALSIDDPTTYEVDIRFSNQHREPPYLLISSGSRNCYIGRVSIPQLAEIFNPHKSRIFNLNIRNYVGDSATNKGIRKSAIEESDDFFFFNNGISALATSIEVDPSDSRVLRCRDLSVINGAQTVRSVHKAHAQSPQSVSNAHVLMRVTEWSGKRTTGEQEFLDKVTKYNNTQNAIKISDFRSNDKVQLDLQRKFGALASADGRKYFYKNKRSGEPQKDKIIIKMEDFIKTVFSFQLGPDDVYGGTSYIYDASEEGGYTKLFGDGVEILPSLSVELFELYAGTWFCCKEGEKHLKRSSKEDPHNALERRWMFFFALGESLRECYRLGNQDLDGRLRHCAKPARLGQTSGGRILLAIEEHSEIAISSLKDSYDAAEKESKGEFVHRNWFRSQSTLTSIRERTHSTWNILKRRVESYIF